MNFNEWLTQKDAKGLKTGTDAELLENQVEQWITKLVGLLHDVSGDRKKKLVEKVVTELQKRA